MYNYINTFLINAKFLFFKLFFKEKELTLIPSNKVNISIKVLTTEIRYFILNRKIKNLNKKNFLWNGNWDKYPKKISIYFKYNINFYSIYQIFKKKINYKFCDEYIFKKKMIKKFGQDARGHKNLKELNLYFQSLLKLKKNISSKGFLSQKRLKKNIRDEIGVFIDRDGNIIKAQDKFGGTHRFAIAKILKLKYVYINIKAIHLEYFKKLFYKKLSKNKLDRYLSSELIKILNN